MKIRSPFTTHRASASRSVGFTVLELAVVLVVIGLIIGGVLKTEQVYRNYRIRNVINQYRELSAAVKVYRDKYGYWPGDDLKANVHVGSPYVSPIANGGGNERVIDYITATIREFHAVGDHLSRAGLITGDYDASVVGKQLVKHKFGGDVYIYYQAMGEPLASNKSGNNIRFDNLPYDVAQAFDIAIDDGNNRTGTVVASEAYTAAATAAYGGNVRYTFCFIE